MAIVEAQNLCKSFKKTQAVNKLSLKIQEGTIFGLVGPDGAGKTTTMRMLSTVMEPDSGDAWVDGKHVVKEAEAIKSNIGYMSQKFGLYSDLTVMENLLFYADIYGVHGEKRRHKLAQLLDFSKLKPFQDRLAENLSGGMKQKLGLSCALIHTPKILFLDEPTNGVDPVSRRDFWRILYELHREGQTIILSTAYMDEAERCGHVAFLYKGEMMTEGSPEQVKKHLSGTVLEVRCKAPRKALLRLREEIGQDCVKLFGNRIHIYVYTENPKLSLQQVKKILKESALGDYQVRETSPSLEDIFMHLMRRKEKEDPDVAY